MLSKLLSFVVASRTRPSRGLLRHRYRALQRRYPDSDLVRRTRTAYLLQYRPRSAVHPRVCGTLRRNTQVCPRRSARDVLEPQRVSRLKRCVNHRFQPDFAACSRSCLSSTSNRVSKRQCDGNEPTVDRDPPVATALDRSLFIDGSLSASSDRTGSFGR